MLDLGISLALMATLAAAQDEPDTVCDLRFTPGERRAEDIRIQCSEGAGPAARQAAMAQIDWTRRGAMDGLHSLQDVTESLELDQASDGSWSVRPERLMRVPPLYPVSAAEDAHVANCRIRFDVRDGNPRVSGVNCVTDGNARDFERATRRAVESWVYTRNYNRRCQLTTINFGIQDPNSERISETARPADPPCD